MKEGFKLSLLVLALTGALFQQANAQDISVLAKAGWKDWTVTQEDAECHSLTHPDGVGIYITSGGNDPVCTPTPHSAIRISGQED